MYEYAKTVQQELRCAASRHRLADSIPRNHTWHLGRYRLTIAKGADRRPLSSGIR
jgi:hypothetical protein